MIGRRLKLAREAAGLSQRELAKRANLSAMAVSKFERDLLTPSSKTLIALSSALGVRAEFFFRRGEVELTDVDYRKHRALPVGEERQIRAAVIEQLERWAALSELVATPWLEAPRIPDDLPAVIRSENEIEIAADALRRAWALGEHPIAELIDVVESNAILVIEAETASERFDGLTALVQGQPVIAIGAGERWPGDRQRFTLAHELGHIVLCGRLDSALDEERACHRFAGALLVPTCAAYTTLGRARRWLEPKELHLAKHEYGLSMQAWIHRARDLAIISKSTYTQLMRFFRKHGWHKHEPGSPYPRERSTLFEQLVYRGLAEGAYGESKAAELLGIPITALHQQRMLEDSDEAAGQ